MEEFILMLRPLGGVVHRRRIYMAEEKSKKEPKKEKDISEKTSVKSYKQDIKAETQKISRGVAQIQASIKEQAKENDAAVKFFNTGVKELEKGIEEQARENNAAAKRLQANVDKKISEFEAYAREFYFGQSK